MMKEILERLKEKIYNIVGDSEDKLVYSKIRKLLIETFIKHGMCC